jgi:hypothetical protein
VVFGCKERGATGDWRKLIGSFMVFTCEQILLGSQNVDWQVMWHIGGS